MVMNAATADLTSLSKDLTKAGQDAPSVMDKFLGTLAMEIESQMKALAPVKTGRLRNSIRTMHTPGRVQIGPVDVDYDVYQEYGTGSRGEFGSSKPKVVHIRRGRQKVSIVLTGVRPHPYARPAFKQVMDQQLPNAAQLGVTMIVGGPDAH